MKKRQIIILVLFMCILLGGCNRSEGYHEETKTDTDTQKVFSNIPLYDDSKDISDSSENLNITKGEKNALESAKQYLRVMAFSYSGLIEQLEYEGYSNSEATYAADNCGADWYEQAALCAESYLNSMPFSRQGLIEQLEYEGFSYEQAVYGVEQNGY